MIKPAMSPLPPLAYLKTHVGEISGQLESFSHCFCRTFVKWPSCRTWGLLKHLQKPFIIHVFSKLVDFRALLGVVLGLFGAVLGLSCAVMHLLWAIFGCRLAFLTTLWPFRWLSWTSLGVPYKALGGKDSL